MRKRIVFTVLSLVLLCTACSTSKNINEKQKIQKNILVSNMVDEETKEEVKEALSQYLDAKNVENFITQVSDYNETVERVSLIQGFQDTVQPQYNLAKMGELWTSKKGEFPGTNCRISTFMLLKGDIETGKGEYNDSSLFVDHDAIQIGSIFNPEEIEEFNRLFSKIKTETSKDVKVHAKKMEEYFANMQFSDKAKMISVVLHENFDGDYLFIGHTGVLVEEEGGYLFVEKLAFEEPYQAVKFKEKEEVYYYHFNKYKDYYDETTAKPFIMENGKFISLENE